LRSRAFATGTTWRGAGKVFGDKLQWIVEEGRPAAAILRIWRVETDKDGVDTEVQELAVFHVDAKGACQYRAVSVKTPSANDLALEQAKVAAASSCKEK